MKTVVGAYINDPRNIGDQMSVPGSYVDWTDLNYKTRDVRTDISNWVEDIVIFGGGGMIHPYVVQCMRGISQAVLKRGGVVFGWGLGTNFHGRESGFWPRFMDTWTGVFIRDYGSPYGFCPCASCLHPLFDYRVNTPAHDVVVYQHHDHPFDLSVPTMTNDSQDFEAVIKFLRSGQVVVTNTFHGAYWSLLCGCRVVLWNPFSNRFYCALPPLPIANRSNIKQRLAQVQHMPIYDGYALQCRQTNIHVKLLILNWLR